MSPEACSCQPLDKANDIYAFAMVMYELCNTKCRFPWDEEITSGRRSLESIKQYVINGKRPALPAAQEHGMPERFTQLMKKCWSQDAEDRPQISYIVKELEEMLKGQPCQLVPGDFANNSNWETDLFDSFSVEYLSVHQGFVMEMASKKTAEAMKKHQYIPEVLKKEVEDLIREKDARNACVFLGVAVSLTVTEVFTETAVEQTITDTLQVLKNISDDAIFNLPSKINSFRDMDSYYSVKEGIDIMKTAGVINHNIQATEMLLSNPALMNNHQNNLQAAVLTLLESEESSAAIYVCPPLAITLLKVQKTSNRGFLCIVDTHSVPQSLGGNDKGILLATEFDETTKNSKCSLVCEWLKKGTSFYGIPEETRQSLMKIERDGPALADFEWDEWNESEIEDVLNDTLTKYGQVQEETEDEKVTNTTKQDVSEVTSEASPTIVEQPGPEN